MLTQQDDVGIDAGRKRGRSISAITLEGRITPSSNQP